MVFCYCSPSRLIHMHSLICNLNRFLVEKKKRKKQWYWNTNKLTSKHRSYNPANNVDCPYQNLKMSCLIWGAKNIKHSACFIHFGSSFTGLKIIHTHCMVICSGVRANQNRKPWKLQKKLLMHMIQRFNYQVTKFVYFWNNIGYLKLNVHINMCLILKWNLI